MFSLLFEQGAEKAAEGLGWLSSVGITGGMAACLAMAWLFLRNQSEERAARAETDKATRDHIEKLSARTESAMEKFADTSLTIHRECQSSGERREAELRQLIRDQQKAG